MNSKIRDYIEKLFEEAPVTRKALELREEMISNAEEKYNDLLKDGYREEDAFTIVIQSMGDVQELFWELEQEERGAWFYEQEMVLREKKARFTAIAVGMYIFAGAVFFMFVSWGGKAENWGMVIAAFLCIAPTVMLIYAAMLLPGGRQGEQIRKAEYRERESNPATKKAARGLISSILWTGILIMYFAISFNTGAWYITWVIFLVGGCVESAIQLFFSMRK